MTTTSTKPASREADLLAGLGLPAGASSQDVESAHDDLVAYLEAAPADLRPWARRQIAAVDEAFALLSDPTIDRSPSAAVEAVAPVAAATMPAAAKGSAATDDELDELDELELDHPATRHGRREAERRSRAAATRAASATGSPSRRNGLMKRLAIGAAVVVGVVAVGLVGFNLNGGTGVPASPARRLRSPRPRPSTRPQLSALMQKIAANPKDTASLQSIGDLYYQAGDYATAGDLVRQDPRDRPEEHRPPGSRSAPRCTTRTSRPTPRSSGAGRSRPTRRTSRPTTTSGFMYLSQNPPDIAKVKAEWNKVIEIDAELGRRQDGARPTSHSLDGSPAPSGGRQRRRRPAPPPARPSSPAPSK